jgi:peptide/nickel transport system permease protein
MTAHLEESADALPIPESPEEPSARPAGTWRHVRRDPTFIAGSSFLLLLVLAALLAPWIAPHDPNAQELSARLLPPVWLEGGKSAHLLGTDNLGRDVFSRLLYGARLSLLIATLVTLVAGGIGTLLGLLVGYLRGWPERMVMGWIDLQVSFPVILLIILIITVVGPSVVTLVVTISLTHWLIYTRTTRSAVLSVSQSQYVAAAEVAGGTTWRVLSRHVLPNLISLLLTLVLLEFATVILVEAALSFLGLGIQPPHTSWGLDVSIGKEYIFNAWWLVTFPGLAISLTVLALNFVSSSLRSALDPTARATKLLAQVGGQ